MFNSNRVAAAAAASSVVVAARPIYSSRAAHQSAASQSQTSKLETGSNRKRASPKTEHIYQKTETRDLYVSCFPSAKAATIALKVALPGQLFMTHDRPQRNKLVPHIVSVSCGEGERESFDTTSSLLELQHGRELSTCAGCSFSIPCLTLGDSGGFWIYRI